jgi:ABC-type multidrug transport system permease subunit
VEYLSLTKLDLIIMMIMGLIMLLLLFTFIFLGIAAFSSTNGVGPFITALLPMVAGMASSIRLEKVETIINRVKEIIIEVLGTI